jgi:hypothetical protein
MTAERLHPPDDAVRLRRTIECSRRHRSCATRSRRAPVRASSPAFVAEAGLYPPERRGSSAVARTSSVATPSSDGGHLAWWCDCSLLRREERRDSIQEERRGKAIIGKEARRGAVGGQGGTRQGHSGRRSIVPSGNEGAHAGHPGVQAVSRQAVLRETFVGQAGRRQAGIHAVFRETVLGHAVFGQAVLGQAVLGQAVLRQAYRREHAESQTRGRGC